MRNIFLLILLFTCQFAYNQNDYMSSNPAVNLASINVVSFQPQSSFKRTVPNKYGFNLNYLRQVMSEKPLFVGLDFSYFNLGSYEQDIYDNVRLSFITSCTATSLKAFDLNFRYYLPLNSERVQVFSEFLMGINWISTSTSFTYDDTGENVEVFTDLSKGNLKYGANLGLNIKISDLFYINSRIGYHPGLSMRYFIKKNDLTNELLENTLDAFELKQTPINILKWDLGLTFSF